MRVITSGWQEASYNELRRGLWDPRSPHCSCSGHRHRVTKDSHCVTESKPSLRGPDSSLHTPSQAPAEPLQGVVTQHCL